MFVYVQALDYGRLLRIQVEPNELVRSLKAKIDYELGGSQPEAILDSLNYLGITLDCSTPLSTYGIRESSLLYMGNSLSRQPPGQVPTANNQFPQYQQYPNYQAHPQHFYQHQVPQRPVAPSHLINYQQAQMPRPYW